MTRRGLPRLALVVPSLTGEGGVPAAARFIKDVALRSGRFDLRLLSLPESATDPMSLRLTAPRTWATCPAVSTGEWEGVPFVHVGAVAGEFEFQRYRPRRALTRLLMDCDVVQVVCGSPAWANVALGLGRPVAVHAATRARVERRQRDASPRTLPAWWRKAMTEITDRLDDRALRRADAIQVMNPWLLEYAQALNVGRSVDTRHLPPGVNAQRFHPLDTRHPAQDAYILCVARLSDPRKRVGVLLEAYARLPKTLRDQVRLVLAGSSAPPEAFWRQAVTLGLRERISYVERPDERALLQLYREASVFALPSDEEGFGVVLLEAMACGVPVVSTRSGGPDGIITDGEDGFLVPRDDVAELSLRLAQLLENSAMNLEMGRKARQTVERRFDERVAGEAFLDVWERLAHRRGVA